MVSSIQKSITSEVTSAVTTAVAAIQTKYKSEMLFLYELIEKFLLFKDSPSSTPPPDPDIAANVHPSTDSLPKASTKKWNQADFGYYHLHLDRTHGEGEIVSVGKDVYYRNVVFFVQHLQKLITF